LALATNPAVDACTMASPLLWPVARPVLEIVSTPPKYADHATLFV
jgi:hypothetical protein